MTDLALLVLLLVGFGAVIWLYAGDIVRDHWHFVGHRVPGVCCGMKCPHHRSGCIHEKETNHG